MSTHARVRVQEEDFDIGAEVAALRADNSKVGAVACFVGTARDLNEGSAVETMELEHYPGMTKKSLEGIAQQARERWPGSDVLIVSRRQAEAARPDRAGRDHCDASRRSVRVVRVRDGLSKTQAPFWKKEKTEAGEPLGRCPRVRRARAHALDIALIQDASRPTNFAGNGSPAGRSGKRGCGASLPVR